MSVRTVQLGQLGRCGLCFYFMFTHYLFNSNENHGRAQTQGPSSGGEKESKVLRLPFPAVRPTGVRGRLVLWLRIEPSVAAKHAPATCGDGSRANRTLRGRVAVGLFSQQIQIFPPCRSVFVSFGCWSVWGCRGHVASHPRPRPPPGSPTRGGGSYCKPPWPRLPSLWGTPVRGSGRRSAPTQTGSPFQGRPSSRTLRMPRATEPQA